MKLRIPTLEKSPLTGMTEQHYIELANIYWKGLLHILNSINDPFTFPAVPGKTYPQPNDPDWRWRSLEFEALERTFTLAGPLIHVDPDTEIKGINLREYYMQTIVQCTHSGTSEFVADARRFAGFNLPVYL